MIKAKEAMDAWTLLRSHARNADEKWDSPHMGFLSLSEALVKEAYYTAVKYTHPDMGGDAVRFGAVEQANGTLKTWLKQSSTSGAHGGGGKCQRCDGRGYVMSQRAFRQMRVQCARCRGHGELDVEQDNGDPRGA